MPMFEDGDQKLRSTLLVTVAVTSVCISFSIAFGVLYLFPTFFSCRNILFVGIVFIWLLSPLMTRGIMMNSPFGGQKSRWKILVFIDSLIGVSIFLLLVASSCGLGNSCRCWAGFHNKIKGVVLAPGKQFTKNNTYIYPILIAVCLFAQYLVFNVGLYVGRRGLRIMNWSEKDRRASLPKRAVRQEVDAVVDAADSVSEGQAMLGEQRGHELVEYGSWDFDL